MSEIHSKRCFKCGTEKPIDDFYRHSGMSGGHMGKCKECTKKDVAANRSKNIERVAEYERKRFNDPKRKAKVLEYQRRRRARFPEKNLARQRLGYALRTGKVKKQPCCHCGNPETQAHHHDYSKPLDVRWVCFKCHREKEHGQTVLAT